VNEPRLWNWSELGTTDPEGAKTFYAAVFGWETATTDIGGSEYTMWRVPGYDPGDRGDFDAPVDVIGGMSAVTNGARPQWGVAFIVEDVDEAVERAVDLGGAVAMPATTTGPVRAAVLADPQGAAFSVNSLVG
jgi:predicted enzyme related to lactoylglutathione lyase